LDWLAIRRFGAATFRSEDEYAMLLRQMLFELGALSATWKPRAW